MKKKGKKFEIIWVSRDRSPEQFLEYYQKMPWHAVTWDNTEQVAAKLGKDYRIKGIPLFAFINADDGSVINLGGVQEVSKDKYGLSFPYRPRTLTNMLPRPVKKYIDAEVAKASLSLQNLLKGILAEIAPTKLISRLLNLINKDTKREQAAK